MPRRRFGSIRMLRSGRFQVRVRDPWGRTHTAETTFAARRDAERYLQRVEVDIERGTWRDPRVGRVTFSDWAGDYLGSSAHKRPTTLARDRTVIRVHLEPALGRVPLVAITRRDVQLLVDAMSAALAPATVRTNYGVLRAVLGAAVDAELLVANPCRKVRLPQEIGRDKRRATPDELDSLIEAVPNDEYRALVTVSAALGLRWSEAAGLRVGRIDFGAVTTLTVSETVAEVDGRVTSAVVKTRSSRRTMTVPDCCAVVLYHHLTTTGRRGAEQLVFQAPTGGPLRASNFRARVWRPAVRAAGLDGLTFHALRHSDAGYMRVCGAHDQTIQHRLGHSSSQITSRVYGWVPRTEDVALAAALDDLLRGAMRPGGALAGLVAAGEAAASRDAAVGRAGPSATIDDGRPQAARLHVVSQ